MQEQQTTTEQKPKKQEAKQAKNAQQSTGAARKVNSSVQDVKMKKGEPVEVTFDTKIRLANKVDIDLSDFRTKLQNMKDGDSFYIGRTVNGPDDIRIPNDYVSGTHLKIEKVNGKIVVTDMGSTNGTILNTTQPDYAAKFKPREIYDKFGAGKDNGETFYREYDRNYNNLREASYTKESSIRGSVYEFDEALSTANPGIKLTYENGWLWHRPKNGCKGLGKDRVSLNVVGDKKLIEELDRLITKGEFIDKNGKLVKLKNKEFTKGFYKTCLDSDDWLTRHDPITMYFDEKVSPEMLDALAQVTEKYARKPSNGKALMNSLEGKPWIANEIYTPEEQIENLWKRAGRLNSDLADMIYREANEHGHWNVSTGQYAALEKLVNEYEMFLKMSAA